jgi:hypothetical protein
MALTSFKLGKKAKKFSRKALPLSNYMKVSSVAFPPVKAWERSIPWGMLGNDTVGDCTIAGLLHLIMGWNAVAHAGTPVTFTTEQAISLYTAITGYDPADSSTDQGAAMTDVINYAIKNGFYGHQPTGFVTLDVTNTDMVKAAAYLFGGVYFGINVPAYIMNVPVGGSWSQPDGADTSIEGGHAIYIPGYGRDGATLVSWGATYTFNWDFWGTYCDEAYALVSPDWIKASGVSPSGLDLAGLLADLAAV